MSPAVVLFFLFAMQVPPMAQQLMRLVPLFLLLVSAVGCGGVSDVTGSVTYNGKPVKTGSVTVRSTDGTVFSGPITDGNYSVTGIPSGAVTFAVSSPDPANQPASYQGDESPGRGPPVKSGSTTKKPTQGWFAIASKFANPETSGQSTTLKPGPNTFPLTLTDR
jgi:hypothetical protein